MKLIWVVVLCALLSANGYAQSFQGGTVDNRFEFETAAELALFEEYSAKLWGKEDSFANELVKGKKEYIVWVLLSEKFMTGRYKDKPDDWKMNKAIWYWNSIAANILSWGETNSYKFMIDRSPKLVQ